jgi:hypothetical protein
MNILWLIILIVVIVAIFPAWPYSTGWGYRPLGGLLAVVVMLVILRLLGVI